MLAILAGDLSLLVGFAVLFLPLLATELSRPRDGVWGATLLVLGLVLITSNDRLRGAPVLGVLCGGFLIARLGIEVAQSRWQHLSTEEKLRFRSLERWMTSFNQLRLAVVSLGGLIMDFLKLFKPKAKPSSIGKKWVRPEKTNENESLEQSHNAHGELMSAGGEVSEDTLDKTLESMPSSQDS